MIKHDLFQVFQSVLAQEALAIHRALVFAVKTPVNKPGHMPPVLHLPTFSARKCRMALTLIRPTEHCSRPGKQRAAGLFGLLRRFTHAQVPLAEQANLFAGVAFLHHAIDKIVVFFLLVG